MLKIKDLMLTDTPALACSTTVAEARACFAQGRLTALPVLSKDKRVIGLISRQVVEDQQISGNQAISNFVNREIITLRSNTHVVDLAVIQNPLNQVIPIVDELGQFVGILPAGGLISGCYQEINQAIKNFFAIVDWDSLAYAILMIDDQGILTVVNSQAEKILGIKGKEVIGLHVNKVIPDSKLLEVVKRGQAQLWQKMNLEKTTLLTNRLPLMSNGEAIGALAIFKDVSAQEELLRKLRRLEAETKELRAIFSEMPDGIMITDAHGVILRINDTYRKFFGLQDQNCKGLNIQDLPSDFVAETEIPEVIKKPAQVNALFRRPGGNEILTTGIPIFDQRGYLIRVLSVARDVSGLNDISHEIQLAKEMAERYYSELENYENRMKLEMVADSPTMRRIVDLAAKVSRVDSTVLILGESGVGKEVLATAIHKNSLRSEGPFVKVNCGAIPDNLLESELFGHQAGAFTGASRQGKPGLVEVAHEGTLFLDEIGDLPLNLQVKLLRVIQEHEVMRVGGLKPVQVDFRLIAASNKDLETMVQAGTFRQDLYYRLNVVPVIIPPLRERREDIVPLLFHFLKRYNKKYGLQKKMAPEVIARLMNYDWPGNIRELENTVERLVVTSNGNIVTLVEQAASTPTGSQKNYKAKLTLKDALDDLEAKLINDAYQQCRTTREMAEVLGISQSAVVKKMQKYQIGQEIVGKTLRRVEPYEKV